MSALNGSGRTIRINGKPRPMRLTINRLIAIEDKWGGVDQLEEVLGSGMRMMLVLALVGTGEITLDDLAGDDAALTKKIFALGDAIDVPGEMVHVTGAALTDAMGERAEEAGPTKRAKATARTPGTNS